MNFELSGLWEKMNAKIYVSIGGGCYRCAENVPTGHEMVVIDWDNLFGDGDTAEEWKRFDGDAKQFIRANYPEEYKLIQDRLRSDQQNAI